MKYVNKGSSCLIVGCKSERDFVLLEKSGLRCIAIGPSIVLLVYALSKYPKGIFLQGDVATLPCLPSSFDSIYADDLTRVPRKQLNIVLREFRIFLKARGKLYLSFRVYETAGVLEIEDLGGKRYSTLFEKKKIDDLVFKCRFKILWSKETDHTDPSLPRWYSLVVEKE